MIAFIANTVVVDDSDEDFILVGFAHERDGDYHEAIHFQRAYEFDEQDTALGMNKVYIERGSQLRSAYGGIESVSLSRNRIQITLSENTARSLGDEEFEISFDVPVAEFRTLLDGLSKVFDGQVALTVNCVG